MRKAKEFIKEKEIFLEAQAQKYAEKKLIIFWEVLDEAWNNKIEFFKLGKVRVGDETKKLYDVQGEIERRFGENEKTRSLADEITDMSNSLVKAELEMLGWRFELDEESQKIQNLDYLPGWLVPIETEETSAK